MEFPLREACLPVYSFVDIDIIMPACTTVFDTFHPFPVMFCLIHKLNKTTCVLDPFPTTLLISHLSSYSLYYSMYCESVFLVWCFSITCKHSIIFPLIKKQGLGPEILKNYMPVAKISFISKNY